jgi:hypothetical protein
MFEKLASKPVRVRSTSTVEIPLTEAFVACVKAQGFRLSYGALALAAREFGEDDSKQIVAQRGSTLVKGMPLTLQPFVCRKAGDYHKKVLVQFTQELPGDLTDRPVIDKDSVHAAIEIYRAEG